MTQRADERPSPDSLVDRIAERYPLAEHDPVLHEERGVPIPTSSQPPFPPELDPDRPGSHSAEELDYLAHENANIEAGGGLVDRDRYLAVLASAVERNERFGNALLAYWEASETGWPGGDIVTRNYVEGCPGCKQWFTPRIAYALALNLEFIIDMVVEEVALLAQSSATFEEVAEELSGSTFFSLPRVAQGVATPNWLAAQLDCYRRLFDRIIAGELSWPRCTGEEMALHTAFFQARDFWLDGLLFNPGSPELSLPYAQDNLLLAWEACFEDHDVLLLFQPEMDGIESDPDLAKTMGFANLHPRDWHLPFREDHPLEPLEPIQPDLFAVWR